MPWVRFVAPFEYRPKATVTIAYRAGMELSVPTAAADAAIAAGAAVAIKRTAKKDAAQNGSQSED
jgi:hypothetical protein